LISSFLSRCITFLEKKNRPIILSLIAFYVLVGAIYSFYLGNELRYLPDEADYFSLATNFAFKGQYSLDGVRLTAYRPPGYPLLLALFRLIGFNVVGLRILNYFALGFGIFVLFKLLEERFATLAGLLGAFLVMAYPVVFYTAGTLYPQTLASLLLLLILYFYTRAPGRYWEIVLAGLLAGWLILTVPTFVFLVVVLAGWSWVAQDHRIFPRILLMLALPCLVVGMWSLRNFAAFGTFVFVSTNSGENLLLGNSENTTPNGGRTIDFSKYENQAAGLDEFHRDQYFQNQAVQYILAHKLASLKMYFLKLLNFFNYRNELVTNSEGSTTGNLLMLVTYGPLLLVALVRLALSKIYRLSSFEILLVAIYLIGAFVSAIFFTRIRFRVPFDFLLIMLVAVFIDKLIRGRVMKPFTAVS
jgi:hypothetical protein